MAKKTPNPDGQVRPEMTADHLAVLSRVAKGLPAREGGKAPSMREVVAALRLLADFTLTRPAATVDHRVSIFVVNPYRDPADRRALPAIEVPVLVQSADPESKP